MNEEEQQALLDEAKAAHISQEESDDLLEIAQGVGHDEEYVGSDSESD